ncbi:hypothetical protein [Planococcus lenghuensis]|uniref:Uncharacterized protein n=1 Tax=Planococcus lenghuensis TaxID=2213202 RepID=A0A1Q2KVV5_9BACL|nr:hypothetical protein [Planococcus lenghuensis]AQQ52273.1 hypothetical protein B0X71_03535 [Planococcus lenghuensis]
MKQLKPFYSESVQYYFSRVKDTYTENGQTFILQFACLTIERPSQSESVWSKIEKLEWEEASDKLQTTPDNVSTYEVSDAMFQELVKISATCHSELYSLTPLYKRNRLEQLADSAGY